MPLTKLEDVTYAMVKVYFGIAAADTTRDARITAVLPLAIAQIKNHCRNDFEVKARSNEKPVIQSNQGDFYTQYRPLTSASVTLTESGKTLVLGTDYLLDRTTGRVRRAGESFWSPEQDAVVISYTAGEVLDPDAMDVVMVLYELVGLMIGLKTRTYITGEGVEAAITLTSLPDNYLLILERHKLWRL